MKQIKRIGFIMLVTLLLAACGSLPTDGLTASMGTDQTDSSEQGASIDLAVTQCTGEWNPENNMLRLSFQLETDEDLFGTGDAEELRLFGGGATLRRKRKAA